MLPPDLLQSINAWLAEGSSLLTAVRSIVSQFGIAQSPLYRIDSPPEMGYNCHREEEGSMAKSASALDKLETCLHFIDEASSFHVSWRGLSPWPIPRWAVVREVR
jgi:hypothetical protein